MKPLGTSWVHVGRRNRLVALLGSLIAVLVCALAVVGVSDAAPKRSEIHNWPNSPARHRLKQRVGSSTPSFSANLRGGISFAGNTLLTCPENVSSTKRRGKRRGGPEDSNACKNANNNDHNMVYVNVDKSSGHFDSSSATMTVPSGARVVKAFLYWGADLSEGVNRPTVNPPSFAAPGGSDPATNTKWKKADLRVGSGSFTTIDATSPGPRRRIHRHRRVGTTRKTRTPGSPTRCERT